MNKMIKGETNIVSPVIKNVSLIRVNKKNRLANSCLQFFKSGEKSTIVVETNNKGVVTSERTEYGSMKDLYLNAITEYLQHPNDEMLYVDSNRI